MEIMRTRKFRYWDDEAKVMVPWNQIMYKGWEVSMLVQQPYLMDFTGVVDCNGVDIYEGDEVEIIGYGGNPIIGCVTWDVLNCCFHVNNCGLCGPGQSVKVIGNIYET